MKRIIAFFMAVMVGGGCSQQIFAAEDQKIVLKKRCLKAHPLVVDEDDQTLLSIYSQVCDKENKDKENMLLTQAAQRFQTLGKDVKSLQLIQQLEANQVHSNALTDTKFLAATHIAHLAIAQIRTQQVRFLNAADTYPAAKQLVSDIESAKPESILIEEAKAAQSVTYKADKSHMHPVVRKKTTVVKSAPKPKATAVNPQPVAKQETNEKNPFAGL